MILEFFAYFGNIVLALNVILYLLRIRYDSSNSYKIFTIYLVGFFVLQIASVVYFNLNISSVFFSHFLFVFQFVLLSLFFYSLYTKKQQKIAVLSTIPIVLLILIYTYFSEKFIFSNFNTLEIFITYVPIIIFAVLHFYNMLDSKKKFYYTNVGLLIYLLGTLVIFLAGNIIVSITTDTSTLLFYINMSAYIVYQLLLFVEWKQSFSKKIEL